MSNIGFNPDARCWYNPGLRRNGYKLDEGGAGGAGGPRLRLGLGFGGVVFDGDEVGLHLSLSLSSVLPIKELTSNPLDLCSIPDEPFLVDVWPRREKQTSLKYFFWKRAICNTSNYFRENCLTVHNFFRTWPTNWLEKNSEILELEEGAKLEELLSYPVNNPISSTHAHNYLFSIIFQPLNSPVKKDKSCPNTR